MKRLFVTLSALTLVSVAAPAQADCPGGMLDVWPPPGTPLPVNGRVVLEGHGSTATLVDEADKRGAALVAPISGGLVKTVVRYQGSFRLSQAVVQTENPLEQGKTYKLRFHGTEPGQPKRWEPTVMHGGERVKLRWPVTLPTPDEKAPDWLAAPSVVGNHFEMLGCGPASWVKIKTPVGDDRGPVAVRVEVKHLARDGKTHSALVPVKDGHIVVGHDMCFGAFELAPGQRYRLTLTAVDLAGNEKAAPGKPIEVEGPR